MIKQLSLAAVAGIVMGIGFSAPAQAQGSALIVYGNDRCPSNTVCVRAPESERYRIPESLRSGTLAPAQQSWAGRAASVSSTGGMNTGPATCSNIGGGGGGTCLRNQIAAARAEKKAAAAADAASPQPK